MIRPIITRTRILLNNIVTKPQYATAAGAEKPLPFKPPTFVNRIGYMLGMVEMRCSPNILDFSGQKILAICTEYPDVEEFSQKLNLPDTFNTWYNITILHIWMVFIRLRSEGAEGQILKEQIIKNLWVDLDRRMRAFNVLRKRSRQILHSKVIMTGSMLAYDEGILTNSDQILAAALWRNFFNAKEDMTFQELETMVEYIRKNLLHISEIPSEQIFKEGVLDFMPLGVGVSYNIHKANARKNYCITWPSWAK